MNEQLQRAYDALQQAHEAGQAEHAQQIADYIRELEAQAMVQEEKKEKPATNNMLENPVTYGLAGAAAGRLLGPAVGAGIDTAARSMMGRKPPAPGAAPAAPAAPRMEPSMTPQTAAPTPEKGNAVENWAKSQTKIIDPETGKSHGVYYGGRDYKDASARQKLVKEAEEKMEGKFRPIVGSGVLVESGLGDEINQQRFAQEAPPTRSAAQLSAPPAATPPAAPPKPSMLSRMSRNLAEPKKTPLYIGGAMAAGQGRDAYEQAREGNIGQAAMSGAGAVGGLGMLSRIKPIRAAGTLMGLGVPLTRMYKSLTEDEENVERRAAGGLAGYAKGKMVKEIAAGKTPQALEDVLNFFKPKETKMMKASEAFAPNEGGVAHLTQSDRLKATDGELGGFEFSGHQLTKPKYAEAKATWGVASPQEATKIINRNKSVPEGKSVWAPLIGSEKQHQTNPHVFNPMLEEFYNQVKLGKLPKETALDMRGALLKQKYSSGPKKGQLMFPNAPDVRDQDAIRELATSFENRGPLADILFAASGAGKRKGQIIDYEGMIKNMADPKSLGAPTHSIGTRIFTLDNNSIYRPDLHSAFPHILTGADQGVSYPPVPKELFLKEYIDAYRDFNNKEPGTWAFTRKPLSVNITDKLLRRLDDAGMSKGGLAHLASGGRTAAWQRKEGKNPEGGLNAKGRASYHAETGGTLKRPQPEGGARRDSFCSRMKGMKKKLTSAETANDPDSRINKALRKWKC